MTNLESLEREQQEAKERVLKIKTIVDDISKNSNLDGLVSLYSDENKGYEVNGLIDILSSLDINISVVAEVSNGKSTFLNALIFGDSLLSSGAGAVTARLFKITYGDSFAIAIKNKRENYKSLNDLKVALKKLNEHAREEIEKTDNLNENSEEVVIYLPNEKLKKGITIYDTPGFGSLDENIVYKYIQEAVSVSDATVLLLDISQGLKKDEKEFVRIILKNIPTSKRFIVFNKYDEIISEDEKEMMEIEGKNVEEELSKVVTQAKQELAKLAATEPNNIETYILSARGALIGKRNSDSNKLKESKFEEFESNFWNKVALEKEKTYKERVKRVEKFKKDLQDDLNDEKNNLIKREEELKNLITNIKGIHTNFTKFAEETDIKLKDVKESAKAKLNSIKPSDDFYYEIEKIICGAIFDNVCEINFSDKIKFWNLKDKYITKIKDGLEDSAIYMKPTVIEYVESVEKKLIEIENDLNRVIGEINIGLKEYEKYKVKALEEVKIFQEIMADLNIDSNIDYDKHVSLDSEVFVIIAGVVAEIVIANVSRTLLSSTGIGLIIAAIITAIMQTYKKYNDPNKKLAEDVTKEIMKEFKQIFENEALKGLNSIIGSFNDKLLETIGDYSGNIKSIKRALESPEKQEEEIKLTREKIKKVEEYINKLKKV